MIILKLKHHYAFYLLTKMVFFHYSNCKTRELAKKYKPFGLEENRKISKEGGQVANNTRKDIEARLNGTIITKENTLTYQYIDDTKKLGN